MNSPALTLFKIKPHNAAHQRQGKVARLLRKQNA
jgi:hypothetical protein